MVSEVLIIWICVHVTSYSLYPVITRDPPTVFQLVSYISRSTWTQHTMQINFPLHKGNFYLRDSCRIAGSTAVKVSIYDVRIGSLNFPLTGTIFSSATTFHFHGQRINEWRCYAAVSDIPFRLHWRAIVPLRFLVKRYGRKRALPLHLLGPLSFVYSLLPWTNSPDVSNGALATRNSVTRSREETVASPRPRDN